MILSADNLNQTSPYQLTQINAMAGISWIKMTPRDNYGWLKGR